MAFIDYYKILGVDRSIPQKDVRRAYLKRAKQFHPDLHPDDPKAKAKFQALNEAFDVIGDPEKRKKYDQFGEQWKNADAFNSGAGAGSGGSYQWSSQGGSPFEGFDFSGFGEQGGGFSSFFEQLFGGAGGRSTRGRRAARTNSGEMNATVNIDL
ncbi:MAG: DnaJ domain-containing protein, partial [Prevotella sp.]|nr:DnaJ domain-containing protein [Prevotella sp.]